VGLSHALHCRADGPGRVFAGFNTDIYVFWLLGGGGWRLRGESLRRSMKALAKVRFDSHILQSIFCLAKVRTD
jgi:hypothetical protein